PTLEKRQVAGLMLILFGAISISFNIALTLTQHIEPSIYLPTYFACALGEVALLFAGGILLVVSGSTNPADRIAGIFILISGAIGTAGMLLYTFNYVTHAFTGYSYHIFEYIAGFAMMGCMLAAGIVFIARSGSAVKSRVAGIMLLLYVVVVISINLIWDFCPVYLLEPYIPLYWLSVLSNIISGAAFALVIVAGAMIVADRESLKR
nr:hypothetical protein [Candidatus Sigynarchaeota archaeon]